MPVAVAVQYWQKQNEAGRVEGPPALQVLGEHDPAQLDQGVDQEVDRGDAALGLGGPTRARMFTRPPETGCSVTSKPRSRRCPASHAQASASRPVVESTSMSDRARSRRQSAHDGEGGQRTPRLAPDSRQIAHRLLQRSEVSDGQ
jgi:hypothetical protein